MNENAVVLKQTELLGQQFTVYGTKEEPLFVAADVAAMIEHPNTSELIKLVDDEEKLTSTLLRSGQGRKTWMLTENGLYEVLMQSRKPIAKEFKKGVKKILKELRLNGVVTVSNDDETILQAISILQRRLDENSKKLEIAENTIVEKEGEIKVLAPKAQYTDDVLKSEDAYTMTQIAKEFGYTCQAFAEKLIKCGIIYKQSGQYMLSAKYCDNGYATNRTHPFVTNSGQHKTKTYLVWTEKGRKFLHDFRGNYKEKKKKLEERGGF